MAWYKGELSVFFPVFISKHACIFQTMCRYKRMRNMDGIYHYNICIYLYIFLLNLWVDRSHFGASAVAGASRI